MTRARLATSASVQPFQTVWLVSLVFLPLSIGEASKQRSQPKKKASTTYPSLPKINTSTMFLRLSMVAVALFASSSVYGNEMTINQENGDINVDSDAGRRLLKNARGLQDNQMDASFLAGYSVKFQGCHHVQQWNPDAVDEEDVRIMTKRLVRFRLCPASDCSNMDTSGCTSNYGDYVVDMTTYLEAFLMNAYNNGQGQRKTQDAMDFAECQAIGRRRDLEADGDEKDGRKLDQAAYNGGYYYGDINELYVGPYCANQGSEIRLGVFYDDTCSAFAQNGEQIFLQTQGYNLPYASQTMASSQCQSCVNGYNNGNNGYEANEFCEEIYEVSGKCETKLMTGMNGGYGYYTPNESSCSYIEGIKIIREDGVIRTSVMRKSKTAAVFIGVFFTIGFLLAGYVYYLRTKLGRAKINLAAASQTMT